METKTLKFSKTKPSLGKNVNMTEGKILPSMIRFIIPIILTGFLQQFYNTADSIVVGNFGGKESLAAVGATTIIISLTVNTLIGIFTGTNILVARSAGSNDGAALKKIVSTTYVLSIMMGIGLMLVGQLVARPLLEVTKCPENIIDMSETYMRLYFIGIPGSMFNNFASSILRNTGTSRSPFVYLTISGAVNVCMNVVFVLLFNNAVVSVALATVLSIYVACVMFFIHLIRLKDDCRLNPFDFTFDPNVFKRTIKLGIPSVISTACFSLTNLIIQPTINSYGDVGISGNSASASIEAFLYAITGSIGAATSAFIGQNIGAGNKQRVVRVLKTAYLLTIGIMSVYTVISIVFGRELINLFIPGETEAIAFGQYRSLFIMSVAVVNGIMNVNGGAAQAYGYTFLQMASNLVGVCLFRVIWMIFIYPASPNPTTLWLCYPISWVLTAVTLFTIVVILTKRYMRDKLKLK